MFRFLTAGESHGPGLTGILEGIPAGLKLSAEDINYHLQRRQQGYGRGGRMKIEKDHVVFRSGVRHGVTLGSPITLEIENLDWKNWQIAMSITPENGPIEAVTVVRPGHADFAGTIKYNHEDVRNVIERSSARDTAIRVAVGAVCNTFLRQFGVELHSHVLAIGSVGNRRADRSAIGNTFSSTYWEKVEQSPVRCGDSELEVQMIKYIRDCKIQRETCGGVFEVVATGVPIGLGTYSQWDRRLSSKIAMAFMSIPSVKGVEIGGGFEVSSLPGSQVHDSVQWTDDSGWQHPTNNAGGIEGGISNGASIVIRSAVKPIPTVPRPLPTVDIHTRKNLSHGRYERSDTCIVPAAGVIGEAMLAIVLTEAWLEKFGGDSMTEILANFNSYMSRIASPGIDYEEFRVQS